MCVQGPFCYNWCLVQYLVLLLNPLDNHTSTSAILQQNLARTDDESWKEREAAVLSIGAIAEGCITGLYPHLPQVTSDIFIAPYTLQESNSSLD